MSNWYNLNNKYRQKCRKENCWELIDSGEWRECEMYFPIDIQKDVTVQVLNPDGEDTVMAELAYTPQ